ncbi:glycoside hydrolase family 2 protein [Luteolibacter marinus]|uniref:glycoside hydrolase family 2 protein n=1 Tax=Luteolibacter marinus TaxID=2776705 RepID=UPI001D0241EE|nr:sugar-binding domain-containing protein [Luteolibacter marinus]
MKPQTLFALLMSLQAAHAEWKPVEGKIMTPWAKELTPQNAWDEYPRPQLQRDNWTNLNGLWNYAITPKDAAKPSDWAGEILVPFAPESALSGVGKLLEPDQSLWYQRTITASKSEGKRTILHFEAVDYDTTVWLNGQEIGQHTGAHTPFSFDITAALKDGENELVVRVHDATSGYQLVGKQHLKPEGIWYTRVSGIWQSVWMEEVNARAIDDLDFTHDVANGTITVAANLSGPAVDGEKLRVSVSIKGQPAGSAEGSGSATIRLAEPKLWSPAEPNLYDVTVELLDAAGAVIDSAKSYTALRELGKAKDANGNWRFTLNGEPIFHWGPLDQGWWPDGLLTPPSDEAMLSDIEYLKAAGFNMIRKHIKVEPRRYYYHCDRLGMMMWQDQVSQGYGPQSEPKGSNPNWTRLAPDPKDGTWSDEGHAQYLLEYKRMVDHLKDYPCIVVWSPFNEAWGQHRTLEVGKMAVDYDKTRPINIASGGNFWPVGDIADEHAYPDPAFPVGDPRFDDYVKVVGEFGGHGWPVKDHMWDPTKGNWGYGGLPKTLDEWKQRYSKSIDVLRGLKRQGISAGVYTQTTDVEGEVNGLLTYDRVEKIPASWLKPLHDKLLATPDAPSYTTILATSEETALDWKMTTEAPGEGWEKADFDDHAWKTAKAPFSGGGVPNAKFNTPWTTPDIWLRRDFEFDGTVQGNLVLRMFHDEDATVFLNGTEIAQLTGYVGTYTIVDLDERAKTALKSGTNVIAIHVKQTRGGQHIDAGLLDEVQATKP